MEYGFHGYHDDPQVGGNGCYVLPVTVFWIQAYKIGIIRTARLIRFIKTVHAASFIGTSLQTVMVIGILALFIKVPGYGNHLPVPHVKQESSSLST